MRIFFSSVACMPTEQIRENVIYANGLDLPDIGSRQRSGIKIAVCGGGPSLQDSIEELRGWTGEIWAINGVHQFLAKHGIRSILFACDPDPILLDLCVGVTEAILATTCDRSVFDHLIAAGATVTRFNPGDTNRRMGATTATAAPAVAVAMSATDVSFFGCDCSYRGAVKAVHGDVYTGMANGRDTGRWMRIAAAGEIFDTDPELFMQAELLAVVLREFPTVFHDRSGGLLGAMTKDENHDTIAVSDKLAAMITPIYQPALLVRTATFEDTPMLFLWRNDPVHREAIGGMGPETEVSLAEFAAQRRASLEDKNHRTLIFESAGAAIGMVTMNMVDGAVVMWCYVAPAHRRRGVGTEILTMMVTSAGALPVRATVRAGTPGAKMMQRLGYECVGAGEMETWQRGEVRRAA